MNKKILYKLFLPLLISIMSINNSFSQSYPVTSSLIISPPYSVYLNDYYSVGSNSLILNLAFNDYNEPSWDVRLSLTIESAQLKLQTSSEFRGEPITLTPGFTQTLYGYDLSDYFDYDNLTIQGITKSALQKDHRLPTGMYTFSIDVLDYNSGTPLTQKAQFVVFLSLIDEPTTLIPISGTATDASDPQNVMFQWQINTPIADPSLINYTLRLFEVTDNSMNPITAYESNKVYQIFESQPINNNSFLYDLSAPALEKGRKYAFTVQAESTDEKALFKNEGISQVAWFMYGYPENGNIEILLPENDIAYKKNELVKYQWSAPDNLIEGLSYNYKLKVVKLLKNQDANIAIQNNSAWYEREMNDITSWSDWKHNLETELENGVEYAWQVKAYMEGNEIAKSSIYTFWGPPLVDYFLVGNQKVRVKELYNNDVTRLSGKGYVVYNENDKEAEVDFKNIHLQEIAGEYTLFKGEILSAVDPFEVEITAQYEENGKAICTVDSIKLTKNIFNVHGTVTWALPFETISEKPPVVTCKPHWFTFEKFLLQGIARLEEGNQFDLLYPYNFNLDLDESTEFSIYENRYKNRFDGRMWLPDNINSPDDKRVNLPFEDQEQLYYIQIENNTENGKIKTAGNTKLIFTPDYIIDLSDKQSTGKFEGEPDWRGVLFTNITFELVNDVDGTKQLIPVKTISTPVKTLNTEDFAWVSAEGLNVDIVQSFKESDGCKFNTFPGNLNEIKLLVKNNNISDSHFKGRINIYFLDPDNYFTYTVALSNDGFMEGFLDESLEGYSFTFNPDNEKSKLNITLNRAVFAENERLDMNVDIYWPHYQATFKSLSGLRLWGNGEIGFIDRNEWYTLPERPNGSIDQTYNLQFSALNALYKSGYYAFAAKADIELDENVGGLHSPPEIIANSIEPEPRANSDEAYDSLAFYRPPDDNEPAIDEDPVAFFGSKIIDADSEMPFDGDGELYLFLKIDVLVARIEGMARYRKDDPVWGSGFQGYLSGGIRHPINAGAGVIFIYGTKGDFDYWLFELEVGISELKNKGSAANKTYAGQKYAIKSKKTGSSGSKFLEKNGIPIGPITLTSIGGRFYHHMNHKWDTVVTGGEMMGSFDFIPDRNTSFGGMFSIGFIDTQTFGTYLEANGGMELAFNNSGGLNNFGIQAKVSIGNLNTGFTGGLYNASVLIGEGWLTYNVPNKHWKAECTVESETQSICASGQMKIDAKPGAWKFNIGTREEKIKWVPGCVGFSPTGFAEFSNKGAILSLGLRASAELNTGWIGAEGVFRFKPYAGVSMAAGAEAGMTFDPRFAINDVGIWMEASAEISAKYEIGPCPLCDKGKFVLAGAYMSGHITWHITPAPSKIWGELEGRVRFLEWDEDFKIDFEHTL